MLDLISEISLNYWKIWRAYVLIRNNRITGPDPGGQLISDSPIWIRIHNTGFFKRCVIGTIARVPDPDLVDP